MDIAAVLTLKYPNTIWELNGEEYSGLKWNSKTPKPTEQELLDLWPEVEAELETKAKAQANARTSALAKLAALGLTEEEIAAL